MSRSRTLPMSTSSSKKPQASRPSHHANSTATLFRNPWPSAEKPTWTDLLSISNPFSWYSNHNLDANSRARDIKVVAPDWGAASLKEKGLSKDKCVIGTWLGHAGAMIQVPLSGARDARSETPSGAFLREQEDRKSLWVLFDPIFSTRAGPTQYTGPSRMKQSPCQVVDLPACDAVLISHNHYDHMDLMSVKAILKRFPRCRYFVPLGNGKWLQSCGVSKELIVELDWWDEKQFGLEDLGFKSEENDGQEESVKFTCVPAQHNSGRGTLDQASTLWCGWIVEHFLVFKGPDASRTRKGAIYHAGDTGYRRTAASDIVCPIFEEIGEKFGPFDLSFLPIWRGGTLGLFSYAGLRLSHTEIPATFHASPADAIQIHKCVKSQNSVGVHFGTFIGSENESYEAVIEFDEAGEKEGVKRLDDLDNGEHGRASVIDIGGSIAVLIDGKESCL